MWAIDLRSLLYHSRVSCTSQRVSSISQRISKDRKDDHFGVKPLVSGAALSHLGGPEAQLGASMDHLHLNTLEEEEEKKKEEEDEEKEEEDEEEEEEDKEEELGGAAGLDQGSDGPRVSFRTRYRTKDRKDRSRNPERWRKQEREGWE